VVTGPRESWERRALHAAVAAGFVGLVTCAPPVKPAWAAMRRAALLRRRLTRVLLAIDSCGSRQCAA
jgi:hypothetical protein